MRETKKRIVAVLSVSLGLVAGAWIGDGRPELEGEAFYADEGAPVFRAEFSAAGDVKIDIAVAGYYWISVNGTRLSDVSKTSLMPLWSPYDETVYSESHKVPSSLVKAPPAQNEIAVALGNGWYNFPPLAFWGHRIFRNELAHGRPCFKLEVNGKPLKGWKWKESRIVSNHLHLGTVEDRTRSCGEWKDAVEVAGPKGRIVPRTAPAIDIVRTIKGKSKWLVPGKVQVIDWGENVSGIPNFAFPATKKGDLIEIVYGERLNTNGTVNVLTQTAGQIKRGNGGPGAPRVAAQRDALVCGETSDGTEKFTPEFTWHVCRYAEVRGCGELLAPECATLDVIASKVVDTPLAASFRKGKNDDFTRLHEVCRRTFLANLIGVQSDCPGRERLGYGGDIVATCDAFALNWDMREFYLKTLQDFADEAAKDGWLTETAPYVGINSAGFGGRSGPISWTLGVPVLIDCLIRHYGDKRGLKYYPVCANYIKLVDGKHPDGIIPKCIGDHEALVRAPDSFTATAHWHEFVRLTARFADMLGKTEDGAELKKLALKIRKAFVEKWMKDGLAANGSQSAQAMALYLGLVPEKDVPAAEKILVENIKEKGYSLDTGIFSTRYALMYLSEHGYDEIAEKIVLNRKFPGWLYMLDCGATTIWETWKESDNIYSNCHPMFGSVDEWMLRFRSK